MEISIHKDLIPELTRRLLDPDDVGDVVPINAAYVHKKDESQVLISDIERVDTGLLTHLFGEDESPVIGYCQARANLSCSFAFDHPLDHVPGIMLLEMARQAAIASSHRLHDVPVSGYINTIDFISMEYLSFCELDLPLFIIGSDTQVENTKNGLSRVMESYFVQNDVTCAKCVGSMTVIKTSRYVRLRHIGRRRTTGIVGPIPNNRDLVSVGVSGVPAVDMSFAEAVRLPR